MWPLIIFKIFNSTQYMNAAFFKTVLFQNKFNTFKSVFLILFLQPCVCVWRKGANAAENLSFHQYSD